MNLVEICRQMRMDIVEMCYRAGGTHLGGSLSAVEVLAVLYFKILRIDPKNPGWQDRDRFVMSKGHAGPSLYSVLSQRGYFNASELFTLNVNGTKLPSHCDMRKTPGIDMTCGSLGQGLSTAVGMAIAGKIDKKSYRVFCMVGCGENNEGQIWEAVMTASKYRLDNLIVIVDYNHFQLDGPNEDVMPMQKLKERWETFGWLTSEMDGHNIDEVLKVLSESVESRYLGPRCIISHTIKGRGLSSFANRTESHHTKLSEEEYKNAIEELKR